MRKLRSYFKNVACSVIIQIAFRDELRLIMSKALKFFWI